MAAVFNRVHLLSVCVTLLRLEAAQRRGRRRLSSLLLLVHFDIKRKSKGVEVSASQKKNHNLSLSCPNSNADVVVVVVLHIDRAVLMKWVLVESKLTNQWVNLLCRLHTAVSNDYSLG